MDRMRLMICSILFVCITAVPALAGDFDGSKPLICAVIDAVECGPGGQCVEKTPEDIDLVRFFRVDFKKNIISGTGQAGAGRSTTIERMEKVDGKVILQGAEEAREGVRDGVGWTMALSEETGDMVVTASGDHVGFVLFCNCTTTD